MRRLLTLVAIPLVLLVAWYGYQQLLLLQTAKPMPTYETALVEKGTIASTVSATGSIEPNAKVSLAFRIPGLVTKVNVQMDKR